MTATLPPGAAERTFTAGPTVSLAGPARGLDDQMYERVVVREEGREWTLLVDTTGRARYSIEEFSGKLDAPKAALMGVLVDGVLTQRLPWVLILIGALISLTLEMIGVHALPVAVGIYLPISTSAAIFSGGLIRALVERLTRKNQPGSLAEEETGKGILLSSGLIAGGAIGGLLVAAGRVAVGGEEKMGIGGQSWLVTGPWSNTIALVIFALLALFVFRVARQTPSES